MGVKQVPVINESGIAYHVNDWGGPALSPDRTIAEEMIRRWAQWGGLHDLSPPVVVKLVNSDYVEP